MATKFILFFIMLWQKTGLIRSSLSFPQCRFYPTCSNYFIEALKRYGLLLGFLLSIKRVSRCHPLCNGGIDEVPSIKQYGH